MAKDLAQEQRWRDRIGECRQSGLSVQAWCTQNGLKKTAYHYWARKFKLQEQQQAGDNTFAEVVLLPKSETNGKQNESPKAEFSVSFGGYRIGIPDGFNPVTLTELVKVLRKL